MVEFKYFYKYKAPEYYGADKDAFYIRILGETSLFFFAFFTVWLELVQGNTRFCNLKGALDDILYVTYLIGIIVMALQMDEDHFLMENKNAFIVGTQESSFNFFCIVRLVRKLREANDGFY